jgi:DNA polymerase-3 subunit delta
VSEGRDVVLLWGEDRGAIAGHLERIRREVLMPEGVDTGLGAFNHERFDGPYLASIQPVLDACAQLPMMSARRLVECTSPEELGRQVPGSQDAASALDALVAYVEAPAPTTTLVLTSSGLRSNSRLVKAASKGGRVTAIRCDLPGEAEAAQRVVGLARARGSELSPDVAGLLVQRVGPGLAQLEAALDRVLAYTDGRRPRRDDVIAVVRDEKEDFVFELTDAIGRGDGAQALTLLARVFAKGERDIGEAQRLFALLVRHVRNLYTAKIAGPQHAPAALGLPPFIARKVVDQAARATEENLRRAHLGLAALDLQLKGSAAGARLAQQAPMLQLQRWVMNVCGVLPGVDVD